MFILNDILHMSLYTPCVAVWLEGGVNVWLSGWEVV